MSVARIHLPLVSCFAVAGHVAAWPALYAVAALVCFARLTELDIDSNTFAWAAVSVAATTAGAYLLDRVKFADAWIDPADIAAHPARYALLVPHASAFRAGAFALLVVGGLSGAVVSPWAVLAVVASVIGVAAYALKPRKSTARPKDIAGVKNLYTALGLVGFAAGAAIAAGTRQPVPTAWWAWTSTHAAVAAVAGAFLVARVLIDAALCDVDDEATDRAFRTNSLAARRGGTLVRHGAAIASVGLYGALIVVPTIAFAVRLRWASAGVVSATALAFVRPGQFKDFVDLRFPLEAAACLLMASIV